MVQTATTMPFACLEHQGCSNEPRVINECCCIVFLEPTYCSLQARGHILNTEKTNHSTAWHNCSFYFWKLHLILTVNVWGKTHSYFQFGEKNRFLANSVLNMASPLEKLPCAGFIWAWVARRKENANSRVLWKLQEAQAEIAKSLRTQGMSQAHLINTTAVSCTSACCPTAK